MWFQNLKAMEHRIDLLDICITLATNDNEDGEEDYSSNDEVEGNQFNVRSSVM